MVRVAGARQNSVLAASGVAVSKTGDTLETALATIKLPGGMLGANGVLRVSSIWTGTNSANVKTPRLRLGGISGTAFFTGAQTTAVGAAYDARILNRNSTTSQIGMATGCRGDAVMSAFAAIGGAIDTGVDQDIVLSAQLALGTETLTLEAYLIEVIKP